MLREMNTPLWQESSRCIHQPEFAVSLGEHCILEARCLPHGQGQEGCGRDTPSSDALQSICLHNEQLTILKHANTSIVLPTLCADKVSFPFQVSLAIDSHQSLQRDGLLGLWLLFLACGHQH